MSFCEGGSYKPVSVEVENIENHSRETFDIQNGTFSTVDNENIEPDSDKQRLALYVKDKFYLSDEAYHEMSLLSKDIPRLYKIKELTKGLNSTFDIVHSPDGVTGVQQSLKSRLVARLNSLQSLSPSDVIKVKLTGDGTAIGMLLTSPSLCLMKALSHSHHQVITA